jgi:aspartyl-tRNA(Asn)/glutamyl-tRNA(Gln) amidotransferase subunit A
MSPAQMDAVVEQLCSRLRASGIAISEADIQVMAERGYLKPVIAFEQATKDLAMDLVPEYLSAWGHPQDGKDDQEEVPAPHRDLPLHTPPARQAKGLLDESVHDLSRLIRSGELSPVELVETCLERIDERDSLLNAFQLRLDAEARAAALGAEREILSGLYRGPFHGIPVAIKDNLDTAGYPTRAGSIIFGTDVQGNLRPAGADATAVAKLREAGAIIVGKTRMSEFAYSPGSNNDNFGPTRNPHDLLRDAGGSSSGSAAAVADRMVPIALGTDTGGSLRIPASFCGLIGLKPTYGRLSLRGAISLAWSLDHLGPLARNVKDAALMIDLLSGHDPLDPRTRKYTESAIAPELDLQAPQGLRGFHSNFKGSMRIGVLGNDGSGRALANEDVMAAWKHGLSILESSGAELVEVDLPELQSLRSLNATILAIEAATFHLPMLRTRLADYGEYTRLRILAGLAYGPADFIRAQQGRLVLRHRCDKIFDRIDLLSTPTMSSEAPALGKPARIPLTSPFNLLGWPALSLPVGRSREGMPLGMQLIGKPWDEATVLLAAAIAEEALGFV